MSNISQSRRRFDRLLFVLIVLLFLERLAFMLIIGAGEVSSGDDVAYIQGGITFARTGVVSVWSDGPTALIMPATPAVTGLLSRIFGEGVAYLTAVKVLWMLLGSLTAYYIYQSVALFLPGGGWALFAAAALLMPNRAWMDTIISTETPYTFFFMANLYYTLRLRRDMSVKCVLLYTLSFLLALSFRANIAVMPVFTLLWLIINRRWEWGLLGKRLLLCVAVCLIFFVPWTIRNYRVFGEFIPLSYGAGNPTLLGTYYGKGAPADTTLDYETNVDAPIREKYSAYFDDNGEFLNDSYDQFVSARSNMMKARYRMRTWFSRDPMGFLRAYLIEKPFCMPTWVYYWGPWQETVIPLMTALSKLNFVLCCLGLVLAFVLKEKREVLVFLSLVYWANLYLIAFSYAIDRYAALLMPVRYIIGAISLYLVTRAVERAKKRKAIAS